MGRESLTVGAWLKPRFGWGDYAIVLEVDGGKARIQRSNRTGTDTLPQEHILHRWVIMRPQYKSRVKRDVLKDWMVPGTRISRYLQEIEAAVYEVLEVRGYWLRMGREDGTFFFMRAGEARLFTPHLTRHQRI